MLTLHCPTTFIKKNVCAANFLNKMNRIKKISRKACISVFASTNTFELI